MWLSAPEALASLPEVTWQQIGLQQQARGNHWSAFRASYREHWGGDPDLLAAAGYDTARLLALVDAAPPPKTSEGRIDPLGWMIPMSLPSVSARRCNGVSAVSPCGCLQRRVMRASGPVQRHRVRQQPGCCSAGRLVEWLQG